MGATVVWTQKGARVHTVTATGENKGAFDSGNVPPGGSFRQTFLTPGSFNYICLNHSSMSGVVTVNAPTPTPTPVTPTPTPSPTPTPGAPSAAVLPQAHVDITNFAFNPRIVTLAAGGTVTWTQFDTTRHTVTGVEWGSSPLTQGQKYTLTFLRPGKFLYACTIHSFMNGEVNVVATATPSPTP